MRVVESLCGSTSKTLSDYCRGVFYECEGYGCFVLFLIGNSSGRLPDLTRHKHTQQDTHSNHTASSLLAAGDFVSNLEPFRSNEVPLDLLQRRSEQSLHQLFTANDSRVKHRENAQ